MPMSEPCVVLSPSNLPPWAFSVRVFGVVVGAVTAWIWLAFNFRYLLGYHLEHHLALVPTVWYVVLVMVMTVLAGYGAARRATRQSILDDIRTE